MKLVILLLLVGLMAPSLAAEGPYELFESPLYSAEISFPAFSVYPKFSDGSTYREQHVEFVLESSTPAQFLVAVEPRKASN